MKHYAEYFLSDKPFTAEEYATREREAMEDTNQMRRMEVTVQTLAAELNAKSIRQLSNKNREPDKFINFNGAFGMAHLGPKFLEAFIVLVEDGLWWDDGDFSYTGVKVTTDVSKDEIRVTWETCEVRGDE